jgi:hypothetical protein
MVCDGFGHILAKNTKENKEGDESGMHGTAPSSLVDTYCFRLIHLGASRWT